MQPIYLSLGELGFKLIWPGLTMSLREQSHHHYTDRTIEVTGKEI